MRLRVVLSALFLVFTLCALGPPAIAQNAQNSGSIPASPGTGCVPLEVSKSGMVGISITGTWTGTLQAQVAIGGDAAQNVQVTPYSSSTPQATITANGAYSALIGGATFFQLCGASVASGTAKVQLNAVPLAARASVGGAAITGQVQGQPVAGTSVGGVGSSPAFLFADKVPGYTSASDPCAAISTTLANFPLANEGFVDARGLIPVSGHNLTPCSAASTNALLASCAGGYVQLGDYTLWVVLNKSAAGTATLPPQGAIPIPNKCGGLRGIGRGDQNGVNTTIALCTGTNTPRSGCTAPQTREWSISSTTITYAGGRTYLGINATGMDLVAGEPVRIGGSTTKNNDGSWRVCNLNVVNSTRTDANCPANPLSTLVYVVGVSGVTAITTATPGSGQTPGTYTLSASGGGGVNAQIQVIVQAGGTVTTSPVVLNPGSGYTSVPTFTLAAGGTPATFTPSILSACAATCGTLHGEIPVIDTIPLTGNQFAQAIENMAIDAEGVSDAVPYRSLSANEQTRMLYTKLSGSPERALDIHGFNAQNGGQFIGLELYVGSTGAAACDVGTTGFFVADNGPHELEDFTVNLSTCTHTPIACGYVDTNVYPFEIHKGHCENAQKAIIYGQDAPAWNWLAQSWSGVSSVGQCADTANGNCVPSDGPFQNGQSSVATIMPNFPAGSIPATTDYSFRNLTRPSAAATNVLEDWMQTNISTDNSIMDYFVDYNAALACYDVGSSTPSIPPSVCGLAIPVSISTNYCNSTFSASAGTYFLSGNGGGNVFPCATEPTSATLSVPIPVNYHIRKLSCAAGAGGANTEVAAVYVNGVQSNLKCTYTSTACTNDTIVTGVAGDRLGFGITVGVSSTLSAPRCSYIITQ